MPNISRRTFSGVSVLLICIALWLRITQLYNLPVFGDEADHLYWAQEFSTGGLNYPLLMDGKFLLGVLVAQFQPLGPEPLWLGRAVVAIFSVLNLAVCIYLGACFGSRPVGWLAGLFYAILPQSVFHERQLLADPLMATFGAVAIACTWRLVSKRQWALSLGLAIALAAAVLAKLFGGLYLAYPGWAVLLFISKPNWKRPTCQLSASLALGLGLLGGFLFALQPRLGQDTSALVNNQVGFMQCPPLVCRGELAQQLNNLGHSLPFLAESLSLYFGWPLIILALCAWPLAVKPQRYMGWLFLGSFTSLCVFMLAVREFPARYIVFISVPLVVLAASAIAALTQRLSFTRPVVVYGAVLLLTGLTLSPMVNTVPMIWAPRQAALTRFDADLFVNGYLRSGFQEAARFIIAHDSGLTPPIILIAGKGEHSLTAYLDRNRFQVERDTQVDFNEVAQRLLADQTFVYFELVDPNTPPNAGSWLPFNNVELARYPHTPRLSVRLSQIVSAKIDLRDSLFRRDFILPEELQQNYSDLINALPGDRALTLLVYPPNHAQTIIPLAAASRSNVTVIPMGDSWPLDAQALGAELALATSSNPDVRLVFLQETNGDPHRLIETWANTHLFRIDDQWFGPVHLLNFAQADSATQTILVGATFGDGIQLETVDLFDSTAQPGNLVRLRLTWHGLASISQQFKIFVHIFSGDQIVAQHDGQPVGELRPTTTWQVGETIIDQFAIRLPPDTPPGDYQIRIGLYDLATQARPAVLLADGTPAEFFGGGTITVP